MIKKILLGVSALFVLIAAVLVLRAARLQPQAPLAPAIEPVALDEAALAAGLSAALQLPTVSWTNRADIDPAPFRAFHALLRSRFPRLHASLAVERIGDWSLLYTWPGSDATLEPVLLAAHMDVVPVEPGTEAHWTHAPFSGAIADGHVWGRGALDDKSSLMAQLQAVEWLLGHGHAPRRTLYLAYGHDEEIGGTEGAARIAATLRDRGVRLAFTLDEGSALTQGIVPGIDKPVAAIMAGEKGYVTFRLTARTAGGHSSTPTPDGAIARLSRALVRVDDRPLPARLTPPVVAMLERLAPEMPYASRLAIANRDVLEPLLLRVLARSSITNAMIRSTQAITVARAGVKDNVLPAEAYALVNVRLLPGDRIADAQAHLREVVADPTISIGIEPGGFANEAPPPSSASAPGFALIERTVNEVFPGALVSSGLIFATTDNRHYAPIREHAYYFAPFRYTPEDQARVHGTDERIGLAAYADMVRFYVRLLQNAGT